MNRRKVGVRFGKVGVGFRKVRGGVERLNRDFTKKSRVGVTGTLYIIGVEE